MRTYSEREIASIIERAAERQAEADRSEGAPGLTLDEIERLGAEAGIDPAHLRAAAQEVGARGRTVSGDAGMTRTHVHVERWVDGPLTDEAWEDTVAELRQRFGAEMMAMFGMPPPASVQQVGQSHEWSHTSGLGIQTRVTVSPRGDRTRLRITQLVGLSSTRVEGIGYGLLLAFFLGGPAGGGLAAWLGAPGSVALVSALLGVLLVAAVAIPLVTKLDRDWRQKKLRNLGTLADDLAPILAAPREASLEGAAVPVGGRLDLDALGDAPDADARRPTQGRVR